jgi:hypothetical protein
MGFSYPPEGKKIPKKQPWNPTSPILFQYICELKFYPKF